MKRAFRFALQSRVTKAATYSGTAFVSRRLPAYRELLITLNVYSAERDSGDETYDVYVTTGDGDSSWDVVHFPQIASTGVKKYTARVLLDPSGVIQNVTTAVPGVAANDPATLKTDSAGSDQGIKTLGAGLLRHGPIGDRLSHELVIAGTVVTGIDYEIKVEAQ